MAQQTKPPVLPQSLRTGGTTLLGALPGLAPTFTIVALLACVLVPLPTALVDLLLSVSLSGAVLLLVAGLRVRRASDFLSFPSLLLLVTLYRLAINVSTTRLILSQADAGRVVDAFATFVVRNDLVVGGVMFAIISVIQYLVIARGSERVAEVAARFALDGLPGHQQAIEADLRAGRLSPAEASRRRAALMERSSFYGAMDGAIRFVKGDAVAGLAITGINLLGGLAIGIGRMGLSWQESLEVYGRLTIGDGLLAQIPALLVSLAAGVLVSRVDESRDETRPPLRWLQPAMLLVPSAMLLGLALVPSMPSLAFVTTATALVTGAFLLAARQAQDVPLPILGPASIRLRVHPSALSDSRGLERALAELRLRCSRSLGISLPPLRLAVDPSAPDHQWELRLSGRLLARAPLPEPSGNDGLLLVVFRAVMTSAPTLIDLQDLENELEGLRASHPVMVRRALEHVDLADVLQIVRAMLAERLRRPPLVAIIGAIAEDRRFADPAERSRYAEHVRVRLASHWLPDVLDRAQRLGPLRWLRLTPDAEEWLAERTVVGAGGHSLRLSGQQREEWMELLETGCRPDTEAAADESTRTNRHDSRPLVLLTSAAARPAAAELVAGATPHIPVLSTAELAASATAVKPEIEWVDAP